MPKTLEVFLYDIRGPPSTRKNPWKSEMAGLCQSGLMGRPYTSVTCASTSVGPNPTGPANMLTCTHGEEEKNENGASGQGTV